MLEKRFYQSLTELVGGAPERARFVIALSGGVDSSVLFHLALKTLPLENLVVAHFDHAVRSVSAREAEWIKVRATGLGVASVYLGKREGSKTSEEELRNERKAFLKKVRKASFADYVLTAHHANDQLETLMMRLLRGTGLRGLAGILPKSGRTLRPLLTCSKTEICSYARDNKIPFQEDETNVSLEFFRNQVRAELVPAFLHLSDRYGGESKFFERLESVTADLRELRRLTEREAKQWAITHLTRTGFWTRFSKEEWLSLTPWVQERVAENLWRDWTGSSLPKTEVAELTLAVEKNSRVSLLGNIQLTSSCGFVYLQTPIQIQKLKTADWQQLGFSSLPVPSDLGDVEFRFLKPGDRFHGTKMKKLLLEHRVPAPERKLLPVLAVRKSCEILWYFPLGGVLPEAPGFPWAVSTLERKKPGFPTHNSSQK